MRVDALACIGVAALALAACDGPPPGHVALAVGPLSAFERDVQPVLAERCASGGCHGRPDRPLSLYAPGAQRVDPARLFRDEPLTLAELVENARRVCALAETEDTGGALVLRKPLAQRAGGCWHGGGDVFADRSDAGYRAIAGWLARRAPPDGGSP